MTAPDPALQTAAREVNGVAVTRSRIYDRLAAAFRYPSSEAASAWIASGAAEREIVDLLGQLTCPLPPSGGAAGARRPGAGAEEVALQYCSHFDPVTGAAAVSLSERDHAACGREALWEDLFRCYTHFGLTFDGGGLGQPPDRLTIELEFMHYLTFLEASNPASSRGVVLGEADFLRRHLAAWTPGVRDALVGRAPGSVYCRLAQLMCTFIEADCAILDSRALGLRRSRRT